MSQTQPQIDAKQAYLDAASAAAERLPGSRHAWIRELRAQAREQFSATGFPSPRLEAWRYTNLAPLTRAIFRIEAKESAVAAERLRPLLFDGLDAQRLVFVDGRFRSELSSVTPQAGVFAGSIADLLVNQPGAVEGYLGQIGPGDRSALAALNMAFLVDGAYVRIARDAVATRPVHLVYVSTAQALAQPHTLVVAETGSRVALIEHYIGLDDARYFTNAVTEIALEEDARVEHYRIQQEGPQGYHVNGLHVRQSRSSRFVSHAVDLGGLLARTDLHTVLAKGAACELNGLYLAGGRQYVDNHTLIDHAQPDTISRELYKGVLDGRARAVFNGRVVVRPDAQRSDAQQKNDNLLLSQDAEVDTKPELEIYADDVKCSHGATVGQLDLDQLFYLRARGVDEAGARDLLTFAFANDVLQRLSLAPVRTALDRSLMSRLLQGRTIEEVELV